MRLKSFNEYYDNYAHKIKSELVEFTLEWKELIKFLNQNNFDTSKINHLNKDNKFLNKGSYGLVYTYGNDVLKVTFNKDDYKLASRLIGKNFNHLPKVLDIQHLSNKHITLYFIVMEKLYNIPYDLENYLADNREDTRKYFIFEDEKYLNISFNTELFKKYNLLHQFKMIVSELNQLFKFKQNYDTNPANFMMKNGNLYFIDVIDPFKNF